MNDRQVRVVEVTQDLEGQKEEPEKEGFSFFIILLSNSKIYFLFVSRFKRVLKLFLFIALSVLQPKVFPFFKISFSLSSLNSLV